MPRGSNQRQDDHVRRDKERASNHNHDHNDDHNHNHDHECSGTCVKNVKQKTAQDLAKFLRSNRAPPCRFFFTHIVELVLETKK